MRCTATPNRGRRTLARAAWGAALAAAAWQAPGTPASAQTWRATPSITVDETLTNNVNLQPSDKAKGDLVSVVTPTLSFDERGPHTSLNGYVAAPIALYVNTGAENNKIYPSANLLGNLRLYENRLQVEGQATVTQQFFSPFGAQPATLAYATGNRYTSSLYRVSPFLQGTTPGEVTYLVRNNNTWANLNGAPVSTGNSYDDEWIATIEGPLRTFGWAVDGNWNSVKFTGQRPQITELARAKLVWQADPQLRLFVDGGYEDNRFPLVEYRGAIYGGGGEWSPTGRMKVVGNWEHRYFGSSYLFSFSNRTPLSAADVRFSRNVTSYPQQLLTIPATGNVAALLYQMFATRIPDPLARLDFVEKFIADRGLPSALAGPVPIYNEQISLQESASANVGLTGARNGLFLSGFWLRQEPITGSGNPLPGGFVTYNNNTQWGGALAWSHALTPLVSLNATAAYSHTVANDPLVGVFPPTRPTTDQGSVLVMLTAPLTPRTTVYVGARGQKSRGSTLPGLDVSTGSYDELAGLAGFTYTFR